MSELLIKTAKTKELRDVHLATKSFDAQKSEKVISLIRNDGREKECVQFIHEWNHTVDRTLGQGEEEPYERMESALKELNGLLKAVQISDEIQEVNAILGLLDDGNILHVSQAGRAEGYLIRDGQTVHITERNANRGTNAQFLYISSGDLKRHDIVLLSTERILRSMTPAQLAQAARRRGELLETVVGSLESEKEAAALSMISFADGETSLEDLAKESPRREPARERRKRGKLGGFSLPAFSFDVEKYTGKFGKFFSSAQSSVTSAVHDFQKDLQHPTKKRRAHLLLLAGALIVFIGIWAGFQVMTVSRRSQSRGELTTLVEKIKKKGLEREIELIVEDEPTRVML